MIAFWQMYEFYFWFLTAVGFLGLSGAFFILWRRLRRAVSAYQALTRGAEGVQLDALLEQRSAQIERQSTMLAQHEQQLARIARRSLCHVALVRFNAFGDVGGDQSFALALLDGEKNGLVISSIYTRNGTRVYGKPIQGGRSSHHLSEEEVVAITRATGDEALIVQELT